MHEHANELTLPQTCQRLGMRWPRVYNLLLSGALKGRQVGGRWLVEVESIEQFERQRGAEGRARSALAPAI